MKSRYELRRVENISSRPIQSIGTYVSLDAESVVAGSADRNLRFLDTDSLEEIAKCAVNKKSVNCVAISEMSLDGDDPIIVTGGKDSFIQIWDPTSGKLEKNIELPTNEVRSLDIYQGSETLVLVGTKDAKVILWDVQQNMLRMTFEGHRASVHSVSITSSVSDLEEENDLDFLCIASGGADRTARTWDLASGRKRKKFRHQRSISTMTVANKGIRPILATAGVERVIHLWDVDTGILLRSLEGHLDQINTLALWESFQMLIISGSADHTLRVYDILSGECLCVLQGHGDAVLGVTIADYDYPKLVSCSDDLSLIQWDLAGVLADFFYSEDDMHALSDAEADAEGAELGARNREPPYLPAVTYVAPQELDRKKLSKEERKRIRKELKRQKRRKASGQFHSAYAKKVEETKGATGGRMDEGESASSSGRIGGNQLQEGAVAAASFDEDEEEDEDWLGDLSDDEDWLDEEEELAQAAAEAAARALQKQGEKEQQQQQQQLKQTEVSVAERVESAVQEPPPGPLQTCSARSAEHRASLNLVRNIMKSFGISASVGVEPLAPSVSSSGEAPVASTSNLPAGTGGGTGGGSRSTRIVLNTHASAYTRQHLRALANEKQTNFGIAQVESQLEHDRKKEQAQAKLALRLKLKKGIAATTAAGGLDAGAEATPVEVEAPGQKAAADGVVARGGGVGDVSKAHSSNSNEMAELHALKAEKLRQHKLQEHRRKQSMVVAKERSTQALQKRLEELASRRGGGGGRGEGEGATQGQLGCPPGMQGQAQQQLLPPPSQTGSALSSAGALMECAEEEEGSDDSDAGERNELPR